MNRIQALMAGFAATVGVGGIAAYNGAFSPTPPVATILAPPVGEPAKPVAQEAAPSQEMAKVDPAVPATEIKPADEVAPAATPATSATAPVFDVLRVEPNGSVLVAGKADASSQVEILSGSEVLGVAKAEINGDFAIVIDNPLKPGDYQLVLRATRPDGQSAASIETATVSVPDQANGQVLALVEEPGKPSRIITTPQAPAATEVAQVTPAVEPLKPAAEAAAPAAEPAKPIGEPAQPEAVVAKGVTVEAVEVEDDHIFVAGSAEGATTVRVYANDQLLGDAKPGEGNRFLLDVQKVLAPGDYIIKAEGLAADGVTVVSRANVPFQSAEPASVQTQAQNQAAVTMETEPVAGAEAQATAAPNRQLAVIIRRGDTLWQISRRIYGRGVRYSTIYLANKDAINNPNRIFPGQVVKIPDATSEGETANDAEIKKRADQN